MARMINTNLVILAIIGILVLSGANKNVVVGQCQGNMQGFITQCAMYVQKSGPKVNPSPECCHEIKNVTDASCLCQNLTKATLQFVDIQKMIYVAQFYGKPIPSGTNCGGVTMLSSNGGNYLNFMLALITSRGLSIE
ncbi:lipid-transfer protein DIR [Spatholobus suberectus]|nr:lipid-transfer protein DIR [Spatholobus suberectus]